MSQRDLWIGLVHFKPLTPGDWSALDDGENWNQAGAYSNVVSWAADEEEFLARAKELAAAHKLYVVDIENIERTSNRDRSQLGEELEENVLRAETNPEALLFGRFFTYPRDDG